MNVYDTANKLATEIKQSEEYVNYKMAKETLSLKLKLKEEIKEFEVLRYETQLIAMQTGKNDEAKIKEMQDKYMELMLDDDAKKFFEVETKFNILLADINKIIGDSIKDIL